MLLPARIHSKLLDFRLFAPLSPEIPVFSLPPVQFPTKPATSRFSTLYRRLLCHKMARILKIDVTHSSSLNTAAPTKARTRHGHLLSIYLRKGHVRLPTEDPQHTRTKMWQLRKDPRRLRTVERERARLGGIQIGMRDFIHGDVFTRWAIVVGPREGEDFLVEGAG